MKNLRLFVFHMLVSVISYWIALKVGAAGLGSFIEIWLGIFSVAHLSAGLIFLIKWTMDQVSDRTKLLNSSEQEKIEKFIDQLGSDYLKGYEIRKKAKEFFNF